MPTSPSLTQQRNGPSAPSTHFQNQKTRPLTAGACREKLWPRLSAELSCGTANKTNRERSRPPSASFFRSPDHGDRGNQEMIPILFPTLFKISSDLLSWSLV